MSPARAVVAALASCSLAAACTSPTASRVEDDPYVGPTSTAPAAREHLATFHGQMVRFRYPRSWQARHFDEVSSFTGSIADLSNQTMHAPCKRRRVKAGIETSCGWPVGRLPPGGVLMRWQQNGLPVPASWRFSDLPGRPMRVDGRPARQQIQQPGDCEGIGATETITTAIKRAARGNYYSVTACLRGPGLNALERDAQSILASTHLSQP